MPGTVAHHTVRMRHGARAPCEHRAVIPVLAGTRDARSGSKTMADDATKHLFVLGYPDRAAAEAAVAELKELQNDRFIDVGDYAIISKAVGGELAIAESSDADPGAQRGAVTGGVAAAFLALAGPVGLGAIAVGAGVGAVTAAIRDSGFKGDDLEEVGRLMRDGRTLLLVAAKPQDAGRLRGVLDDVPELKAADVRWEAEISAKSKNLLRDAISQYREQEAQREGE